MTDIEIPLEKDRHGWYRFFEILPGTLSWSMLALPFVLSVINATVAAVFIFVYLLINFTRGFAGAMQLLRGHREMVRHQKLPWATMLKELEQDHIPPNAVRPKWHHNAL